jgi:hypothetical protein
MKWLKLFENFGLQSQINNLLKPYKRKVLILEVYPRYGNSIYLNKLFVPVELREERFNQRIYARFNYFCR